MRTIGDLLAEGLRTLGVARVWGEALPGDAHPGIDQISIPDSDLACLMADADGRVNGGHGVAVVPGGILHLSSKPGGTAYPRTVDTAEGLVEALAELGAREIPGTTALHLALDLDERVPDAVVTRRDQPGGVVLTLDPMFADLEIAFVMGAGVVRGGHGEQARRFATSAGVTATATSGAKGVFRWDSPFDGGTIGLQADDVRLAGIGGDVDLVIVSGLDPDETAPERLGAVVQDVEPWQLPALTARWEGSRSAPDGRTALVEILGKLLTRRYESTASPLDPARAALHLSGAAPDDGVVCGEAGWSGFWLARAFPTGIPGALVVPASRQEGAAASMALAARVAGRPALAVCDEIDDTTATVMELARSLGAGLTIQVWGPSGETVEVDEHAQASIASFTSPDVTAHEVAVTARETTDLVDALGPITAWAGLDS